MAKNKKKIQFSKKILYLDYIITAILIVMFIICASINGFYTMNTFNELVSTGVDMSLVNIVTPFNLEIFGVLLGIWIAQLAISSGAYYSVIKSDHQVELPVMLLNELPKSVKDQLDMTETIKAVLSVDK